MLSGIKDRINAQKKYQEEREKQEQIEKEKKINDIAREKNFGNSEDRKLAKI